MWITIEDEHLDTVSLHTSHPAIPIGAAVAATTLAASREDPAVCPLAAFADGDECFVLDEDATMDGEGAPRQWRRGRVVGRTRLVHLELRDSGRALVAEIAADGPAAQALGRNSNPDLVWEELDTDPFGLGPVHVGAEAEAEVVAACVPA